MWRSSLRLKGFSAMALCSLGLFSIGLWEPSLRAASFEGWQEWIVPALRQTRENAVKLRQELEALGTPEVGQTVPQFGYLHPRLKVAPPSSPWIQVDLGESQPIDKIAFIPAQLDWQTLEKRAYGFPARFRVDVSEDVSFTSFISVAAYEETDFPDPGIAPVTVSCEGIRGRYVRLTVTKLAQDEGQLFYALGELMVLNGNRNVANGAAVSASATANFPPRWTLGNVVDGRTALGPPIRRELLPYDGFYSGPSKDGGMPWMMLDLGKEYPIDEIRLHPIHARFGADIPGFSFPAQMRVEVSGNPSFEGATVLSLGTGQEFPNPGNNAVTLRFDGRVGRFVKVTAIGVTRFGLSEMEVYSGDHNVALGSVVSSVQDPATMSKNWPAGQLVDGYTSYGKLSELPEWLDGWGLRTTIQRHLSELQAREVRLVRAAEVWVQRAGVGVGFVILVGIGVGAVLWNLRARRRQREELRGIRERFAHDLHDEIGSNLAAIAVLSAIGKKEAGVDQTEAWEEIQEIAKESNDALHEVLWVSGARQEMGRDFVPHLQNVARRMLPECEIRWTPEVPEVPEGWSLEGRSLVFLFFKEALSNVAKHSSASVVNFLFTTTGNELRLRVEDNGRGISEGSREGTGLRSLQKRARGLGGVCEISTTDGKGTVVELRIPILTDRS